MLARKPILSVSILLVLGLVFGATLVSGFGSWKGVSLAFGASDPTLGGPTPVVPGAEMLQNLNSSFVALSKAVQPTIVAVEVKTEAPKPSASNKMTPENPFFRFFGGGNGDENGDGEMNPFQMPQQGPEEGLGSGVIITSDGYIVTNNHVVKDAAKKGGVRVKLTDKREFDAKVIGTDPTTDLAVIKIDATNLPVAALGNSEELAVGQWVIAVGNPLGLESTVTKGIISSLGRQINIFDRKETSGYGIASFIQTDAAINPGNSGGGLFDVKGAVIGINTAIASQSGMFAGYGFAIPVNMVKSVAMDLIKNGKVNRGYIGVQIKEVDATEAEALGLDRPRGVRIDKVNVGSAGEAAGVKKGDIILMVDGHDVDKSNELQSQIGMHHAGDQVTLKLWRDGKEIEKVVKLKPREDEKEVADNDNASSKEDAKEDASAKKEATLENIGVTVRNLTSDEKEKYNTKGGVYITKVMPASIAYDRGLGGTNRVITEVGHVPVKTAGDFEKAINSNKGRAVGLTLNDDKGDTHFIAIKVPND